ncbi:MAG: hypothetical protein ACM4D3_13940 [Candidatus Sericytochromatia bacterium]
MAETRKKSAAERASDLSDEVLERLETRQRAAVETMRKLIDRLDDATPDVVDPALRKKVVDAIGDYYDQLATTTNEVLRKTVRAEIGMVTNPAGEAKDLYGFLRSFVRRPGEAESDADEPSRHA